jgi:hypothetical protein
MPSKVCSECKTEKDISEFAKNYSKKNLKFGVSYRCKACDSTRAKKYAINNRQKIQKNAREYHLTKNYGMTTTEYESLVSIRNGKCDCCGSVASETTKHPLNKLVIDHCHETGKIRGLLCSRCNIGIGVLGDTLEHTRKAYEYLKRSLNDIGQSPL